MSDEQVPVPVRRESTLRQIYLDAFGCAGIGLTSYGAWLIYQPMGFIIAGGLLIGLVTVGTLRS